MRLDEKRTDKQSRQQRREDTVGRDKIKWQNGLKDDRWLNDKRWDEMRSDQMRRERMNWD